MNDPLVSFLKSFPEPLPVITSPLPFRRIDLGTGNPALGGIDPEDTAAFENFIFGNLLENGAFAGIGGYNEDRAVYRGRAHFDGNAGQPRTVHLGLDIWTAAGTPVHAPLPGRIHSIADNNRHGDYGPTVILEHRSGAARFFTLYGHLARVSLRSLSKGSVLGSGFPFAVTGAPHENGHWPPHLHFQVILDIGSYEGDYPGVCSSKDRDFYLANCPDPALLFSPVCVNDTTPGR